MAWKYVSNNDSSWTEVCYEVYLHFGRNPIVQVSNERVGDVFSFVIHKWTTFTAKMNKTYQYKRHYLKIIYFMSQTWFSIYFEQFSTRKKREREREREKEEAHVFQTRMYTNARVKGRNLEGPPVVWKSWGAFKECGYGHKLISTQRELCEATLLFLPASKERKRRVASQCFMSSAFRFVVH